MDFEIFARGPHPQKEKIPAGWGFLAVLENELLAVFAVFGTF